MTEANKRLSKWSVWQGARQAWLLDMALHKPLHHRQPMGAVSGHELLIYCYIWYFRAAQSWITESTVELSVVPGNIGDMSQVDKHVVKVHIHDVHDSHSSAEAELPFQDFYLLAYFIK